MRHAEADAEGQRHRGDAGGQADDDLLVHVDSSDAGQGEATAGHAGAEMVEKKRERQNERTGISPWNTHSCPGPVSPLAPRRADSATKMDARRITAFPSARCRAGQLKVAAGVQKRCRATGAPTHRHPDDRHRGRRALPWGELRVWPPGRPLKFTGGASG
ncbi:hypothetical protein GCM10010170_055210 [Dactylosporangium salmoneum]|uniref:Uncharacterized protein n=1 Tax=Dactylosporangium salmoneum TaxID=53361 RepID=A0ABP5TWJ4_9ACTN